VFTNAIHLAENRLLGRVTATKRLITAFLMDNLLMPKLRSKISVELNG